MGYYGKEKEPKGVTASDRSGEKMGSEKGPNSMKGVPSVTGAKAPKDATSSDTSGERRAALAGGVGLGKADGLGMRSSAHMGKNDAYVGEMNTGSKEHNCYDHKRVPHVQDSM